MTHIRDRSREREERIIRHKCFATLLPGNTHINEGGISTQLGTFEASFHFDENILYRVVQYDYQPSYQLISNVSEQFSRSTLYREGQLNFTPEIEVFDMLFDSSLKIFSTA